MIEFFKRIYDASKRTLDALLHRDAKVGVAHKYVPEYFTNEGNEFINRDEGFVVGNDRNRVPTFDALNIIAEYYRQKHPDRLRINIVYAPVEPDVEMVAEMIKRLEEEQGVPFKLVLTTCAKSPPTPTHSHPYVVTQDKLISVYDEYYGKNLSEKIAMALKKRLIEPQEGNKSIQADKSSCHFIALGTLKSLNDEQVRQIGELEDQFKVPETLATILKYSQCKKFISEMVAEYGLEKKAVIKTDRRSGEAVTLDQYYDKNFVDHSDKKLIKTKISNKRERMMSDLGELEKLEQKDVPGTDVAARWILSKRVVEQKLKDDSNPKNISKS